MADFLAAKIGLSFCAWAFSCGAWGRHSSCVERVSHCGAFLLQSTGSGALQASTVTAHGLSRSCGAQAYFVLDMWTLPRSGIEPICPALTGRF